MEETKQKPKPALWYKQEAIPGLLILVKPWKRKVFLRSNICFDDDKHTNVTNDS